MARAIIVAVTKSNGNHRILGVFTQAKLAWEALLAEKLPTQTEIVVPKRDPLPMAYAAMNNRLRDFGKLELRFQGYNRGFVQRVELNEVVE